MKSFHGGMKVRGSEETFLMILCNFSIFWIYLGDVVDFADFMKKWMYELDDRNWNLKGVIDGDFKYLLM